MTTAKSVGGFVVTNTKKLLHLSCYDKVNKGFGTDGVMTIGELAEVCVFLGLTEDMSAKSLRKRSGVRYIRPRLVEKLDGDGFQWEPSQLL